MDNKDGAAPQEKTVMSIKPICQKVTAEMVAIEICNCIINGVFKPGEKLNEVALCQQLGVSRTPLREAFRLLQAQGLVENKPYCGVVVRVVSEQYLKDIMDLRCALDILAVTNVTKNINDETVKELLPLKEEPDGPFTEYDKEFHMTIVRLSGNIELEKIYSHIWNMSLLIHCGNAVSIDRQKKSWKEHCDIVDALIGGDTATACEMMKLHYANSTENLLKMFLASNSSEEAFSQK